MKCMYHKYFTKYRFNEQTNNLDESVVGIETQLEYKTCKEYRKYFWFMFKIMIGFLIVMWSLVVASGVGTNFEGEFIVGVACCIPLSIVLITVCLTLGIKGYDLVLSKEDCELAFKNNKEYQELLEHNATELIIMYQWRERHPFEEKVRQALESKNGNDVANVIKMILEKEIM